MSDFSGEFVCCMVVCDCVMVKDRFHEILGLYETEHYVMGQQNPEQNGKRGCAQIFSHPCESASSTSDDHKFSRPNSDSHVLGLYGKLAEYRI